MPVIFLLVVLAATLLAQTSMCDPYILVSSTNPFGYRLRNDRCEGVYVQPVANTPLVVASFGQINIDKLPDAKDTLTIEWTALQSGAIKLRASGLRPRLYYRMDAVRPEGSRSYKWPTDVLSALGLKSDDIGVVAWTERKIGTVIRDVYIPVHVGPTVGQPNSYDLVVVPGNELGEMTVSVNAVTSDGKLGKQILAPRPLGYGYYPAGRSIKLRLDPLPAPGNYLVQLAATLKSGGAIAHEIWLTH